MVQLRNLLKVVILNGFTLLCIIFLSSSSYMIEAFSCPVLFNIRNNVVTTSSKRMFITHNKNSKTTPTILLQLNNNNNNNNDNSDNETNNNSKRIFLPESDTFVIGIGGIIASLITFYSEYTLKTTGCGIPAGPFGLAGLVEGLSYLGVTAIVAYSLYIKIQSGKGLPSGRYGLLGLAEGLSFLTIIIGFIVLLFQITEYGYIPNAVPTDGGMCM